MEEEFEKLEVVELDDRLRRFYAEVQTRDGQVYSKAALAGMRAAINRHLTSNPWNRKINIIRDKEFQRSNNMFVGLIKRMKRDGNDKTRHHEPISDIDLQKLESTGVLSINNPTALLHKVWFDVSFYFGRRGREGQRRLTPSSFSVGKDDEGREYVELNINEKEKNHPGAVQDGQHKHGRMYEQHTSPNCPVSAFKLYLQKLNPKCDAFFQRPLVKKQTEENALWYANAPLGEKTLSKMMTEISKAANLSRVYTNHCVRATTCTVLDKMGASTHQIMAVTGHKNEASVRSYTNKLCIRQKQFISDALTMSKTGGADQSGLRNPIELHNRNVSLGTPNMPNVSNVNTHGFPQTSASTATYNTANFVNVESKHPFGLFTNCHFYGNVKVNMKK